jgi:hypothetical protein
MVRPSRPSPQGTPAAPREIAGAGQATPAGGSALWAPYAPEARRGGRRGGAKRPFACPLREAVHALASSLMSGQSPER